MAKGINFATLEFKQKLVDIINNSDLPLCIIQSALNEIQMQVGAQLERAIEAERKACETKEGDNNGKEIHKD